MIDVWKIYEFDSVESTNDEAKKIALNIESKKNAIISKKQTNGRGRRGRFWQEFDGNLFLSMLFEFPIRYIGLLQLIASLSLLEVIKGYKKDIVINLKWPNDILVDGKKISGILIEKTEGDFFVLGIGVNVLSYPNLDGKYLATSLKEAGIDIDRYQLMRDYISSFDKNMEIFKEGRFEEIRQKWLEYAINLQKEILVSLENQVIKGIFLGLDANCNLIIEKEGKPLTVYAGDVFFN